MPWLTFESTLLVSITLIIVGQCVSFLSVPLLRWSLAVASVAALTAGFLIPFQSANVLALEAWAVLCTAMLILAAFCSLVKLPLTPHLALQTVLLCPSMALISEFFFSLVVGVHGESGQPFSRTFSVENPVLVWSLLLAAEFISLIANLSRIVTARRMNYRPVSRAALLALWLLGVLALSSNFIFFGDLHLFPAQLDLEVGEVNFAQAEMKPGLPSIPIDSASTSLGSTMRWPTLEVKEFAPRYPFSILQLILVSLVAFSGVAAASLLPIAEPSARRDRARIMQSVVRGSMPSTELSERDTLIKEIHHRVKNNLQLITSFTNIQLRKTKSKESEEVLQTTRSRVRAIALVHELLYSSSDFTKIELLPCISLLAKEHRQSTMWPRLVPIEVSGASVTASLDTAVLCCLSLNELLIHTSKYIDPEQKASLSIHLETLGASSVRVTTTAYGSLLPGAEELLGSSDSLPLQIVGTLMSQLSGTFERVHNPDFRKYTLTFLL